jgi:hypothetical protein
MHAIIPAECGRCFGAIVRVQEHPASVPVAQTKGWRPGELEGFVSRGQPPASGHGTGRVEQARRENRRGWTSRESASTGEEGIHPHGVLTGGVLLEDVHKDAPISPLRPREARRV